MMIAGALFGLGACSRDEETPPADDREAAAEEQSGENSDELELAIGCAVKLDTAAKLPAGEEEEDLPEASNAADQLSLAASYRSQAADIATSLGVGEAELNKRFAAEQQRIESERRNRAPDDFGVWATGEADGCPAI